MQNRSLEVLQNRSLELASEILVGIEDNKPEAIAAVRRAASTTDIEVVTFPTRYPSGGEKQLIQILTGQEVPSGGLPIDIGMVMQNVGTAAAIYRAVVHGEPLISLSLPPSPIFHFPPESLQLY